MPTTIFYIGATGYIGGAVLADLVQAYPDIRVTALVRNPAHSAALKANNNVVDVVEGSFSDIALITSKAREADITFNTGDSDDVALTKAILAGHKLRVTEDSKPPAALVHISGVAVFADGTTDGKHDPRAKVWNDGNEADIRSVDSKMVHGDIDEIIMRASEEGYTVSYIVAPGAVVGKSTGAVRTASIFFKFNTELSLTFKKSIYVGEGANVFYFVHLEDVVSFFRLLFAHIQSGKVAKASPYSRYYLVVANPIAWKDIATAIGASLKRYGKLEDEKPQSIPITDLQIVSVYVGQSQHVKGERAQALGWEPKRVPIVLEEWADEGIQAALEKL
ncbi:hypothetical protein V8E52_002643 [Russula decolorans]